MDGNHKYVCSGVWKFICEVLLCILLFLCCGYRYQHCGCLRYWHVQLHWETGLWIAGTRGETLQDCSWNQEEDQVKGKEPLKGVFRTSAGDKDSWFLDCSERSNKWVVVEEDISLKVSY